MTRRFFHAVASILFVIAGCAKPVLRESGLSRPPSEKIADEQPATLTRIVANPPSISWKSSSIFRKKAPYLYGSDSPTSNFFLAEGEFHYFDPGNVRISYRTAKDGFTYREIIKKGVSFRRRTSPFRLPLEAGVEDHAVFIALEIVCRELPCAGEVRVYDAYQPFRSLTVERHISQIWGNCFLGKPLPDDVTLKQEQRFSVAEGSEMGDYLEDALQFVIDNVDIVKRENPQARFR